MKLTTGLKLYSHKLQTGVLHSLNFPVESMKLNQVMAEIADSSKN